MNGKTVAIILAGAVGSRLGWSTVSFLEKALKEVQYIKSRVSRG
ncbi:hypothetical protein [Thermococcus sp.]|nr:hypothetical protein [Thermococcus sp.]